MDNTDNDDKQMTSCSEAIGREFDELKAQGPGAANADKLKAALKSQDFLDEMAKEPAPPREKVIDWTALAEIGKRLEESGRAVQDVAASKNPEGVKKLTSGIAPVLQDYLRAIGHIRT